MARTKTNTKTNASANTNKVVVPDFATATIQGTVAGYYDKGKKYDYVTIDVRHNYDEYYDRFKVAVNKSFECPDDGELIALDCIMRCYKGEVTFKEVNADTQ